MTSSNGNIFRVTGRLWGEFTGHRWIPLTKASDAEFWCILWSAPEQRLSNQSRRQWFETPSWSLWRHCKVLSGKVSRHYILLYLIKYVFSVVLSCWNLTHSSVLIPKYHKTPQSWFKIRPMVTSVVFNYDLYRIISNEFVSRDNTFKISDGREENRNMSCRSVGFYRNSFCLCCSCTFCNRRLLSLSHID